MATAAPVRTSRPGRGSSCASAGSCCIFLALTHFAITHITNDVTDTNIDFVGKRWSNPLWQVFDWALLRSRSCTASTACARSSTTTCATCSSRATVKSVLYTLSLGLFAFGTLTIFTFSS